MPSQQPNTSTNQPKSETSTAPPSYTKNKLPQDMTQEERLASMRAFAEEQKYIQPGGGEITPYNSGDAEGGFNAVIFGNPLQGPTSFRMATDGVRGSLPPPEYGSKAAGEGGVEGEKERKGSLVQRLFRKGDKEEKEGKGDRVVR